MTKKPKPLTPGEAADWLDALAPIEIKNQLIDYLRWQATHGKILLHSAHYFRMIHYGSKPRPETEAKRWEQVRPLTNGIGRTVA